MANDHDLLVRIDERVDNIHERMGDFVTQKEFGPVKKIAYGAVSGLGVVIIAAIGLIFSRK